MYRQNLHLPAAHLFFLLAVLNSLLGATKVPFARSGKVRTSGMLQESWNWTTCFAPGSPYYGPPLLISPWYGIVLDFPSTAPQGLPDAVGIDLRSGGIVSNVTLPLRKFSPLLAQNLFLQVGQAEVHAFLLPSLLPLWSIDTFPVFLAGPTAAGVVTAQADVFCILLGEPAVFPPQHTYPSCFSTSNGSLLWTMLTNTSSGSGNTSANGLLESDGILFWYNTAWETVNAAEVDSGKLLWSSHQKYAAFVAACRGILFLVTSEGFIALEGKTGQLLWKRLAYIDQLVPATCVGNLLVTSIGGFDINNGTLVWAMPSELNCATPVVSMQQGRNGKVPKFVCYTTPTPYPPPCIYFNYSIGDALTGAILKTESVITPTAPCGDYPVLASELGFYYVGFDQVGPQSERYCIHALNY